MQRDGSKQLRYDVVYSGGDNSSNRDNGSNPITNEEIGISLSTTGRSSSVNNNDTVIGARRNGSAASLVKNDKGEIVSVERRISGSDLMVAARRSASSNTMPSIFSPPPVDPNAKPVIDAKDALDRTGGDGAGQAYSEHMFPLDIIGAKFDTHIDPENLSKSRGLSASKAAQLLEMHGPNVLTPPPRIPLWLLFLLQFTNILIILLELTCLATFILYLTDTSVLTNIYLAGLLFIVIVATCYETFSQEAKADKLMETFRNMVPAQATVIRDGETIPLKVSEIVLGDLITVKSGDKVPADMRILSSSGMKVDQSMITGESEPVESSVIAHDPKILEARNVIFSGSLCVEGSCLGVVIRTGDGTLIGGMVGLTGDVGKSSGTLKKDMEYFVKFLALFAFAQAALIFIVGLSRGLDPVQVFINGFVLILVGNVPQGLPTTVTACLFIIADKMGAHNVFVKKIDIIETLGSCTCICTDKTGTLTQNLMSVANFWVVNSKFTCKEMLDLNESEVSSGKSDSQTSMLITIASLNSRIVLERKNEDAPLKPNGDATELGLYRTMNQLIKQRTGQDIEVYRSDNPKIHEIPFNSSNKWQMSIHKLTSSNSEVMFVKGAPDVLLSKCSRFLSSTGAILEIDAAFNATYTNVYEAFGGEGERVLGFAMYQFDKTLSEQEALNPQFKDHLKDRLIGKKENPINDLIFVGLITLQDPPRDEVPKAIADCYSAGVKVVMVTGDHPLTAAAIARKIGLITVPTREILAKERGIPPSQVPEADVKAVVVHGSEIPGMSEKDWDVLLNKQEVVFARTSPEQKLKIVNEFTKAGHITAMTGDGVNDSPALKQAAIGVAMGLNGSDVAREAADIVLLDDNFASIVIGIKEGRLLFANLKKSVAYTLSHLVPEVFPIFLWAFAGIPQPSGSLLVLVIDLCTELIPATSLAYEKPESLIMQVPPRNTKTDKLTSFPLLIYSYALSGMILTGGCFYVYFRTFAYYDVSASDLFTLNNEYFPASPADNIFTTSTGRVYSPSDQNFILYSVAAGWFLMIVCGQATHIYCCRTTTVSIFQHGLWTNNVTNFGILFAASAACFVVYTPGLQDVVSAQRPLAIDVFIGTIIVFFAMWSFTETRKLFTRTYPQHWLNKYLAW